MTSRTPYLLIIFLFSILNLCYGQENPIADEERVLQEASSLFKAEGESLNESLEYLKSTWSTAYIPILLDVIQHLNYKKDSSPIIRLIEQKTGQKFGTDLDKWNNWLWSQEESILSNYGDWMASIHKKMDRRFPKYFYGQTATANIRLDQVKWGGVKQDGIPPLRNPKMTDADEAKYLANGDVVFGISINGDHRAYPKRILAWHEMFVDNIGNIPIAGVYCTLCGTVIAYNTRHDDVTHDLGTSGFLYKSNKLMYDKATQSLWNTIEGKPVIGPLANKNIELATYSVVTTNWGTWKKKHPDTKVLSIETGHQRDYDEGIAYERYFATDDLMFQVPELDKRLSNKEEVLIVRTEGYQKDPLAISAKYLKRKKIYQDQSHETDFVVLTDKSGANRAYVSGGIQFSKIDGQFAIDDKGKLWSITEVALISEDGLQLNRLPSHRIFWFAWYSTYNNTRLVK